VGGVRPQGSAADARTRRRPMSQAGEEPVDLDACTAVLLSVPQQVAERIESFLTANGIACRIRQDTELTPEVWEVLVRPEDLPGSAERGGPTPKLNVPMPGPVTVEEPVDAEPDRPEAAPAVGSPAVLCELPWDQAWALTQRLNEAGIPAAVMAPDESDRDRPMGARMVPVGVRPDDVQRAQAFLP
jgi:hypothetical protein